MLQTASKVLLLSAMSACLMVTFRSEALAQGSLYCNPTTCADNGQCANEGKFCVTDASRVGQCHCQN